MVAGATKITVKFAHGVEVAAKLVGTSRDADIAVIQVAVVATELHPLTLGSSDALKLGQGVVALGSPFGRSGTMTTGIVDVPSRCFTSMFTTEGLRLAYRSSSSRSRLIAAGSGPSAPTGGPGSRPWFDPEVATASVRVHPVRTAHAATA